MNPMNSLPTIKTFFGTLVRGGSILGLSTLLAVPLLAVEGIHIPDAGLKAAIRTALNKPTGPITVTDMESLTELDASRWSRGSDVNLIGPIGSLEGLETAKNLTVLNLSGYVENHTFATVRPGLSTTDLSPLADLNELTQLDLTWNQLPTLILPEGLRSLTTLKLSNNRLTDVSFLNDLSSLESLDLGRNGLTSLTLPESLSALTTLNLGWNPLTSLTFPESLSGLRSLDLSGNRLMDLDRKSVV